MADITLTAEEATLCVEALQWMAGELPRSRSADAVRLNLLARKLDGALAPELQPPPVRKET